MHMSVISVSLQVMYVTATFPYLVTTIFLVRSVMLDGAGAGIKYMFTPDVSSSDKRPRALLAFPIAGRLWGRVGGSSAPGWSKMVFLGRHWATAVRFFG